MEKRIKNSNFSGILYKHALAWIIFITYEILYLYLVGAPLSKFPNYVLNYSLNIALFYFNAHILFPFVMEKLRGSVLLGLLLITIEIIFFTLLKYPVNVLMLDSYMPLKTLEEYRMHLVTNGMRSFFMVGLSSAYAFARMTNQRSKQIASLETQRLIQQNEKILLQKDLLRSRNAYLQAQVNPHLLFNTLNFMFNASAKVSAKLAESVMTLSDIMRYALANSAADGKVPLEDEINHIRNYIQLNQIRFDEKLNIEMEINGEASEIRIIPLALITLIENVFKYGDLLDDAQPATIILNISNCNIELKLFNKKRANRRTQGHGTGIANLKERLDIYYPEAYCLNINDMEDTYSLTLNLTLKSNHA